jgi:hypothetical protein
LALLLVLELVIVLVLGFVDASTAGADVVASFLLVPAQFAKY